MSYIQRLLDSASPMAAGPALSLMPALSANSPVLAADQRLGVFPGLVDTPAPEPVRVEGPSFDTGAPPAPLSSPAPALRDRTEAAPPPTRRDQPSVDSAALPPLAPDPAAFAPEPPQPTRAPTSLLQWLAESAPLPAPSAAPPRRTITVADGPAPPRFEAVTPMPDPNAPSAPPLPPALARLAPGLVTPDQFRPVPATDAQAAPAARQVVSPVAVSVPLAPIPQPVAAQTMPQPRSQPFPQPAPLQPAADDGPSPFARAPQVPLPPDVRTTAREAPRPAEVRVVERIREVPTPATAPPKAATAAAQSVIGPLGQRQSGWRPRQEGV